MTTPRTRTINLDDTPPNATTGTTGTTGSDAADPERTPKFRKLETRVHGLHADIGAATGAFVDDFLGILIARNAGGFASAWVDLAEQDPKVAKALENVVSGGAWANVIGQYVGGIALPYMAFRGLLPDEMSERVLMMLGVQDPEFGALIATMRAGRNGDTPT